MPMPGTQSGAFSATLVLAVLNASSPRLATASVALATTGLSLVRRASRAICS
ncbi:MAG: hypothetical protein ACT4QG_08595 [Sporichthyaceae bacterium]